MRKIIGAILSSVRKSFRDTFNRSDTTTGLGASSDGSLWTALRGNLKVTTNKATTSDSASTYPAATVNLPSVATTISLTGTGNGGGAMLWVTDSGNWWATDIYQYSYSTDWYYNQATGNYVCNQYGSYQSCGGAYQNYSCSAYVSGYCCPICNAWNSNNSKNAAYCASYTYSSTYAYSCTGTGSYSCAFYYWNYECVASSAVYQSVYGGTYYYYPTYIRILQSVANSVSAVTSKYLGDNLTIASLKTLLSGNQITVRGYSDANLTTQVGTDLVYTATGAAVTTQYGIVITPSGSNVVNAVDSITIQ